jgi:pimeloyl-ACP methyl ester carboxylesterase
MARTANDGKYGKIARAFNQDRGNAGALRSDLARDPTTAGLRIDRTLSSGDHMVLIDRRNSEIVIAIRPTVVPQLGVHGAAQRDGSLGALTRLVKQKYGPLGFNRVEVVGTGPHGGLVAFTVGVDGSISNQRVDEEVVGEKDKRKISARQPTIQSRYEIHSRPIPDALSTRPEKRSKLTLQSESYRTTKRPGDMRYYGVISQAAYMDGDESKYSPLFRKHGMGGMVLDKKLSSKKNSVFYDQATGHVVISYRGTRPSDAEDIADDLAIVAGLERYTSRFKQAEKLYKQVEAKYGKENIAITGHSLGGEIAITVAERHDVEAHVFSPGMSLPTAFQTHKGNNNHTYMYYTRHDPVPMAARYSMDSNRITHVVPQSNTWNPHAVDNFIEDKTRKTTEDIWDLTEQSSVFALGEAISGLEDLIDEMVGQEFGPGAEKAMKFFRQTVVPAYVESSDRYAQGLVERDIKDPPKDSVEQVSRALDYDIGFGF